MYDDYDEWIPDEFWVHATVEYSHEIPYKFAYWKYIGIWGVIGSKGDGTLYSS